jgi:hypothetical protein
MSGRGRRRRSTLGSRLAVATLLLILARSGVAQELALDFTGTSGNRFVAELTFGWGFSVHEPIVVTRLGFFDSFTGAFPGAGDGPGLVQDHRVRLWTASGELLADTVITNASDPLPSIGSGRWLLNNVPPVELAPGPYVIGADDPACPGGICDFIHYSTTATTASAITFDVTRDRFSLGFPDLEEPDRDDGYFGATFVFETPPAVPALSSLALLGLVGAMACTGIWLRSRA